MRQYFFGADGSTTWNREQLEGLTNYRHRDVDIRDTAAIDALFAECGKDIALVIHTAAQPSHDWAARDPITDFTRDSSAAVTSNRTSLWAPSEKPVRFRLATASRWLASSSRSPGSIPTIPNLTTVPRRKNVVNG